MKSINVTRYALFIVATGIALGLLAAIVTGLLDAMAWNLPPGLSGGIIVGGGLAAAIVAANRGIRNGRFRWLTKDD